MSVWNKPDQPPHRPSDTVSESDDDALEPGELLKKLRGELDMTQSQLASALGYSRTYIATTEGGRDISAGYLKAFAARFPACSERLGQIRLESPRRRRRAQSGPLGEFDEMFFKRCDRTADLDGDWFALWETTQDRSPVLNTEVLNFNMRLDGKLFIENVAVSPENVEGGYLWIAECRMFDNQYLLGAYIAREPNVRSKGCLYLVIHQSGRFISGQWIGCSYDGDWGRGLVVMARDRKRLLQLMKRHREEIPNMPYNKNVNRRS
jgi:transcriptional regulator with XRE-family HTH domain